MPDHRRNRRRRVAVVYVAFVAIALTVGCAAEKTLPQPLQGRYVTSNPDYADRSFSLTEDTFAMDLGEHGTESYAIQAVRRNETRDGRVLYEVDYGKGSWQELTMAFYYTQADGGSLVMRNQSQVIWKRDEAQP